jgi:amino acid adenylation domain-containing protein
VSDVGRDNSFIPFEKDDIEQSIGSRFEHQAACRPDCLAAADSLGSYTYAELNTKANRIAHGLLSRFGHCGRPVGLYFPQGIDIIAAILGVLKAGMIWVPLPHPGQPIRNRAVLKDTEAVCILCNSANDDSAKVLAGTSRPLFSLAEVSAGASGGNPGVGVSPDQLSQILFTSGSSGQPKGVLNNHRNVLHSIRLHTNSLAISASDRLTQLTPCHYLAGSTAVFRALCNGASVMPYDLVRREIDALPGWLYSSSITLYHSVPTVFRAMLAVERNPRLFGSIRLVHLGGEPVLSGDVNLFKLYFRRGATLLNNLGSTEVSSYLQLFIDHDLIFPETQIPVGYPVEDKEVLLLNEAGTEVGEGETGQITVRSAYLALGYWNQPGLTDEKFQGSGERRTYYTGDLGLRTPDGLIYYRGRMDQQVKVRGVRVELGEVESLLSAHPIVSMAAVKLYTANSGEPSLVAYLQVHTSEMPAAQVWRKYLAKLLPEAMIPTVFVRLDQFPRKPNGKIDRDHLPAPKVRVRNSPGGRPQTPLEEVLAAIWMEILGLQQVDIRDDFFELGGHSLKATQLINRVNKTFALKFSIRAVLESPTIEDLALSIAEALACK